MTNAERYWLKLKWIVPKSIEGINVIFSKDGKNILQQQFTKTNKSMMLSSTANFQNNYTTMTKSFGCYKISHFMIVDVIDPVSGEILILGTSLRF